MREHVEGVEAKGPSILALMYKHAIANVVTSAGEDFCQGAFFLNLGLSFCCFYNSKGR